MRVAITGASGNVGTSLLRSLADEPAVESIVGICRRVPELRMPKLDWRAADVVTSDLRRCFEGAGAIVHLAWLIQPGRDRDTLRAVNVEGSRRVFAAAAAVGVPAIVYASSVGAYGPGPKDRRVDESWPTTGIPSSFYARHKSEVERILDAFEHEHPDVRVVRLRKALIFKREAASEIRRLFAGPLLPGSLLRRSLIPVMPDIERLVFQAVHSYDVGEAYRLALTGDARGPFNIAAEPVLDPDALARILHARKLRVPRRLARAAASLAFAGRLQPSEPGWLDLALSVPTMDTTRAERVLGWKPRWSSEEALRDLLAGLREGAGLDTPPLEPGNAGPLRVREILSGVGARLG